jgi:hypothetical protein
MKMSKLGYFSGFLLFPPLVLIATLLAYRSLMPPQPVICVIVYGGGLVGWSLIAVFRDKCPLLAISRHDLGRDWMLLNCCAGCAVLVCPFTAQSHAKPWPKS